MQEKRQVVEALREQFTVKQLCEYLQLSRSGYYQYLKRQSEDHDKELKERIQAIYVKRQMKYGYRRIQGELEREGWKVNHKKVLRFLMQVMSQDKNIVL